MTTHYQLEKFTPEQEDDILQRSIDFHGETVELDQCIEECAELILAIRHRRRGKAGTREVIQEAVDVMLVLKQIRRMFDPEYFDAYMQHKLQRLDMRLNEFTSRKAAAGVYEGP